MFRSARHRSPITPRWVRGLLAGAFLAFVAINNVGCGLDLRLPQYLAAARDGLVVRLADPAVAIAAAGRRHQARRARQGADSRPDPGRVRPRGLPRPAQRGRGLEQGAQVQERLPAVLRDPAEQRPDLDREDRREDRPVQGLPAGRPLPARALPLQVHGLLRRAVLVGLSDPVQPRRSQGRGRLHRQGPPPPLRRARASRRRRRFDRSRSSRRIHEGDRFPGHDAREPVPFDVSMPSDDRRVRRPRAFTCRRRTGRSSSARRATAECRTRRSRSSRRT